MENNKFQYKYVYEAAAEETDSGEGFAQGEAEQINQDLERFKKACLAWISILRGVVPAESKELLD